MNILKFTAFLSIIFLTIAPITSRADDRLTTHCQQKFTNGMVAGLTPFSAELWFKNDVQDINIIDQGTPLGGNGKCLGSAYFAADDFSPAETVHFFVYLGAAGTSVIIDGWAVASIKLEDGKISGIYTEILTDELEYDQAYQMARHTFLEVINRP